MLRIVMGYGPKGSKDLKALYVGEDGEAAEKVLFAENAKFPRREYIVRPAVSKVRVDVTEEEIERGKQQLADEAAAEAAAAEAARLAAIDPVAELEAERDALAARVKELEAEKVPAGGNAPAPVPTPTTEKEKNK